MDRRRILALILSLLLLASCGGGGGSVASGDGRSDSSDGPVGRVPPPLDPGAAPEPGPPFEWRYFSSYPSSYSAVPQNLVARNQSEFDDIWSLMMFEPMLGPGMDPVQQPPQIDFDKEILVAVFIGSWQGHSTVAITNILKVGDGARVEFEQYTIGPEPDAPYGQPYAAALMSRVDGEITFSGKIINVRE